MAKITIQAGDFLQGDGHFENDAFTLKTVRNPSEGEKIPLSRVARLTIANEETARHLMPALGWGVAGALVAGPVGFMAGLWFGGKEHEVTFVATLKDGRMLTAIANRETFGQINDTLAPKTPRDRLA